MFQPLILLVEDNPDHLELAVTTLQDHGVLADIAVAHDGAEALDFLFCQGVHADRNPQQQPSLVLLDIKLPKLSGIDVLRAIRRNPNTALVPVVMMTSSSEHSDVRACYEAGANSFVRKAVQFEAFSTRLNQVQAYWLQVNEPLTSDSCFSPLTR